VRGKLVGIIDMRDKAARQPFDKADIPKAQHIADRMVELLADKPIFGHRFITLSRDSGKHSVIQQGTTPSGTYMSADAAPAAAAPAPAAAPVVPPVPLTPVVPAGATPPAPPSQLRAHVPRLATLVIDARSIASGIMAATTPEIISENEVAAAREVLRSILLIPGATAAMFSALGANGGIQEISAHSSLTDEAKNVLQSKLTVWLSKRGESGGVTRTAVLTPFGTAGAPVGGADVQKVFTAPVTVGSVRGLYLTVAFGGAPDRTAHELLAVLHAHLQLVIEQSMQRGAAASLQLRIAEKLVEPQFAKYPELRRHSDAVAKLCESFARYLAVSPAEADAARIVGMVHDAGMRLLDYDRLYRKRDLTPEELGFLREHPAVSAAMVEPLLGSEIARAVLCHHERVDGRGYPHELSGEEIPLLSRILQLCDAWVSMTDPDSYQPPEPPENALALITSAAGAQFDAALAMRFVEMMRSADRERRALSPST